jgi:peptidoglycan/LPS O-acetylase OafA/YrhL
VLFTVFGFGALTLFDNEFNYLKTHLRSAAGFYINFKLQTEGGYFDINSIYKPLLHFWSLAIEEQFYLVWPLVICLMYKLASVKKNIARNKIANLMILFSSLFLFVSLFYFFVDKSDHYFSSFVRAWELLVGCVAAIFYKKASESPALQQKIDAFSPQLTVTGLSFIVAAQGVFQPHISAILSVLGAAFYLIAKDEINVKRFLKLSPIVFVGLVSYSLYLWHWPVLSFYRSFNPGLTNIETVSLVLFSFLISAATYKLIEEPIKKQNWDLDLNKNQIATNKIKLFKVAACVIPALLFYKFGPQLPKLKDKKTNELTVKEDSELNANSTCLFGEAKVKELGLTWCLNEIREKKRNGLLLGDSHAHALYKGMVSNGSHANWQLVAKHSCPPFNLGSGSCKNVMAESLEFLKQNKEFDYVVLTLANRVFKEYFVNFSDDKVKENIVADLKAIQQTGKKVVLMRPVPEIAENIYSCTNQRFSFYQVFNSEDICRIRLTNWLETSKDQNAFLDQLQKTIPDVTIVDPLPEICDNNYCYATRDGQALYEDKDHLSYHGSQIIAKKVIEAIEGKNLN